MARHARIDEARVARHARYLRMSRCESMSKQHILQFGNRVGVEELVCGRVASEVQQILSNVPHASRLPMQGRRHDDDARVALQTRRQTSSQLEVAQMVRRDRLFRAVFSKVVGGRHDAGVQH